MGKWGDTCFSLKNISSFTCILFIGSTKDDIDIFEINEAFASQAFYCQRELGVPAEKVNPKGGAIAFGHPLGCTGAGMISTLLYEMKRRKKR